MAADELSPDEPLSQAELRSILRRERNDKSMIRWLASTLVVVMFLFGVVAGYGVYYIKTSQDRQDCARHYSSLLGARTNAAVFAGLEQNSQLAQALFRSVTTDTRAGTNPDAVANFGAITTELAHALDIAAGRNGHPKPATPDDAVDNGMVLDGHRYSACPKV